MTRRQPSTDGRPALGHLVAIPRGTPPMPAVDVAGCDVDGRARRLQLADPGRWTLLLFLGTHCDGCRPFWGCPGAPVGCGLDPEDAAVVVTRGPAHEDPGALAALMGGEPADGAPRLVMSDAAWSAYRVHGAPFFVLVDGVAVVSEGVAWSLEQVAADVARARRPPLEEAERRPGARR